MAPKRVGALTINSGDTASVVVRFFRSQQILLPAALDSGKVTSLYGVQAIPTNYVLSADGRVVGAFEGYDEPGIRQALRKAGVR